MNEDLPEKENNLFSKKIAKINDILTSDPVNLKKLQHLAICPGGLINDDIRKISWPMLMQVDVSHGMNLEFDEIKSHKYYNQVTLDVKRSLKRFPPGIEEQDRFLLMDQLTSLIIKILSKHPYLHYYQGYHDVAITFLLVVGESASFAMVEKLSLTHLREFMRPTMKKTTYYLSYFYPVLRRVNEELYNHILNSNVGTMFCLPWLITWYAHTLSNYRDVVRLYDFLLASPHLMPMYVAVSIVLFRERDILEAECDLAAIHLVLSKVPDDLPFEDILVEATALHKLHPPECVQDEVEEFIRQRKLQEEKEKRELLERRKRGPASKYGRFSLSRLALLLVNLPPSTKRFAAAAALALAASVAAVIYSYYSPSSHHR